MANYKGHLVGGVVFAAVFWAVIFFVPITYFAEMAGILHGWQATAAIFVLIMLFALFPDVDTNSKVQDIFLGAAFLIDVLLIVNGNIEAAAYLGLIAMLPIITHHRGWTHTKWAMFAVPLPLLVVPYLHNEAILPASIVYYSAAVTGYFSHLFLDGLIIKQFRIKN